MKNASLLVEKQPFDLVLMDVWLPKMDGLTALEKIHEQDGAPMVVMISGHASIETAVRATKLGAFDFIEKPLSLEKTILAVKNCVEYLRLEEENRRLRAELEHRHQIIGNSVPMKALRQQIALTAPTNGRVLIYGESGTGKELIARALHATEPARIDALRRSELRRDSRGTDRVRAVRPSQRELHGGFRRQGWQISESGQLARYSWMKLAT